MSRRGKTGIVVLCALAVAVIAGVLIYNYRKKSEKKNEMAPALEKIERINESSSFRGKKLLDAVPQDFNASILNILGQESDYTDEDYDYYHCERFNGSYCITQFTLHSKSEHLFGIHVGDSIAAMEEVMKQEGYEVTKKDEWLVEYHEKYIGIYYEITEDQKVKSIHVGIEDPDEEQID